MNFATHCKSHILSLIVKPRLRWKPFLPIVAKHPKFLLKPRLLEIKSILKVSTVKQHTLSELIVIWHGVGKLCNWTASYHIGDENTKLWYCLAFLDTVGQSHGGLGLLLNYYMFLICISLWWDHNHLIRFASFYPLVCRVLSTALILDFVLDRIHRPVVFCLYVCPYCWKGNLFSSLLW